jgi:sugar/nucleoside kinase (ribokinase family)
MKKILCIGSVTTDILISPADSIPSPGTMRSVKNVTTRVGGCASNAAIDLAKLGAPAILSCKVGKDIFGDFVINTSKSAGVDVSSVVQDASVSTTTSVVCINSSGERSMFYNPGSTSTFTQEDISEEALAKSDIAFVAGSLILTAFDGSPCAEFLRRAQEAGKYTVMDTAWDFDGIWLPKIRESIRFLNLFMPSYEEASKLSGETEVDKIADKFFGMGAKNVIIKIGKDGAYFCEQDGSRYILPTYNFVKPVDTTGAGDSFCAGFLCGLAQGWDYRQSGQFANAVGSHCIMKIGASSGIKSIGEILRFMKAHPLL